MFAGCHEVGRHSGSAGGRLPRLISLLARCVWAAALLWAAGSVFPCQTKPFPGHRGGISKHLPAGARREELGLEMPVLCSSPLFSEIHSNSFDASQSQHNISQKISACGNSCSAV